MTYTADPAFLASLDQALAAFHDRHTADNDTADTTTTKETTQ